MPRSGPKDLSFLTERPFAHRGLHVAGGVVENSIAAFDGAIAAGYGIELDVRLTLDKEVVVFHDAELDRLTASTGRVADRTSAELSKIKLTGTNESIRTLREVIGHINGRAPTLIEVKSPGRHGFVSMCRAIRRSIEGANGWAVIMSFDPNIVGWFREHAPLTGRGLVITEHGSAKTRGIQGWIARQLAFRRSRPHFLAYDIRSLPNATSTAFRGASLPVLTWTVRSDEDRNKAAEHADQIIFEQVPAIAS
jgi:glycerophosphoryl diester phosphodiesterase